MSCIHIPSLAIRGIAACVPKHQVSNRDYERISPKEQQLLIKTTGIEFRRRATEKECTSDLCIASAEKLLEDLAWEKESIEAIVLVTQTPDYLIPGTAMLIQDRMGLPKSCMALDINLGCSGYVYGLSVLASLMRGGLKRGLLLVGDVITRIVSQEDKSTAPIFSDAGTATALEWDESAADMFFNLQSDGGGYEAIMIRDGGMKYPMKPESFVQEEVRKGVFLAPNQLAMKGVEIFNFTLREIVPNIRELMAYSGKELEEFDYCVFHQANMLLNESIRRKLKLAPEKVPYSIQKFGNTSVSTIPLTIVSELREVIQSQPLKLLLSGFGVGLSWGSALIQTDGMICPELMEYA